MKTKSIFFLAVGIILVLSLLCGCSGSDSGAVIENDNPGNSQSENNEEKIDLSQLK